MLTLPDALKEQLQCNQIYLKKIRNHFLDAIFENCLKSPKQSIVVLSRVHRNKPRFRYKLWCRAHILRYLSWIYLEFPGAISLEHSYQLEMKCRGAILYINFSLLNDRVNINALGTLKFLKMFVFHHDSHNDKR